MKSILIKVLLASAMTCVCVSGAQAATSIVETGKANTKLQERLNQKPVAKTKAVDSSTLRERVRKYAQTTNKATGTSQNGVKPATKNKVSNAVPLHQQLPKRAPKPPLSTIPLHKQLG